MGDDAPIRRHHAAERRQDARRDRPAVLERVVNKPAEQHRPAGAMPGDELAHLIDRPNAVEIAFTRRGSPREQPVAAQNQSVRAFMIADGLLDEQRQLKPGALPRHPDNPAAVLSIELVELAFAVCAGRQRNRPVRMQVIHVGKRQKRVQRGID